MGKGRREKRDNVGGSGTERYAISAQTPPKKRNSWGCAEEEEALRGEKSEKSN